MFRVLALVIALAGFPFATRAFAFGGSVVADTPADRCLAIAAHRPFLMKSSQITHFRDISIGCQLSLKQRRETSAERR